MAGSSVGCLGMLHGKITKLMLDLDMEKELEVDLRVCRELYALVCGIDTMYVYRDH